MQHAEAVVSFLNGGREVERYFRPNGGTSKAIYLGTFELGTAVRDWVDDGIEDRFWAKVRYVDEEEDLNMEEIWSYLRLKVGDVVKVNEHDAWLLGVVVPTKPTKPTKRKNKVGASR